MSWGRWIDDQLDLVRASDRWRETRAFDASGPRGAIDGRSVVSFASNDYLGLAFDPAVTEAAADAARRWGAGSTASRLIVGTRSLHDQLESALAAWKHTEGALVFSTGYAANTGVLSTFGGADVTVCSDERNHASIIDGCRLSRSRVQIYRHADAGHLDEILTGAKGRSIVVSDSVFSMDGDVAPLDDLQECCSRHGALLVLDEAHAVIGPEPAVRDDVELIRVGTLSKTLGSLGGWVAGAQPVIDLLVNRARPFIFSTALTPPDTAAALAALQVLRSARGEALLARLRAAIERVAPAHPSPIVPVIVGDERDALALAAHLLERGLLVPAIRPPTVAPGTSRLRIALSADHTDDDLTLLVSALAEARPGWRPESGAALAR